jgi:hypothetical protein
LLFFHFSGQPLEWPSGEMIELIEHLVTTLREADPVAAASVAVLERVVSPAWPLEPLIDIAMELLTILRAVAPDTAAVLVDILGEISSNADVMAYQRGARPPGMPRDMEPLIRKLARARRARQRGRPPAWKVPDMVQVVSAVMPQIEVHLASLATIPARRQLASWVERMEQLWAHHAGVVAPGLAMPKVLPGRVKSLRKPLARAVEFVAALYTTDPHTVREALRRSRRLRD